MGRKRSTIFWLTSQLRCIYRYCGTRWSHHGSRSARRWPLDTRLFHADQENFGHVGLFRIHAVQGKPTNRFDRLRPAGGKRDAIPPKDDCRRYELLRPTHRL